VQSVLHRLKASISVETRPGKGTTFRMKLPLTLAIIKALLFWVEQRLYAIPLNAVLEISRTFETEVHQVDNYEVLQLRNQVLPLLRLGRPALAGGDRKSKLFVLIITAGERKYGLIVDALEGEEELVIKALDDQTFSTDLVSGASILGVSATAAIDGAGQVTGVIIVDGGTGISGPVTVEFVGQPGYTTTFSERMEAVVFALRSKSAHALPKNAAGGGDWAGAGRPDMGPEERRRDGLDNARRDPLSDRPDCRGPGGLGAADAGGVGGDDAATAGGGGDLQPARTDNARRLDRAYVGVGDAQQCGHLRRCGVGENLSHRALLQHRAGVDHDQLVGEQGRLLGVMCHQNRGQRLLALQRAQLAGQARTHGGVQRAEWLVQQEQRRVAREGAHERHPSPLAAGQLRRKAVREAIEVEALEPPRREGWVGVDRERDLLPHRAARKQRLVLREVADAPAGGADAARRRSGPPIPLYLESLAVAGGADPRPRYEGRQVRAGQGSEESSAMGSVRTGKHVHPSRTGHRRQPRLSFPGDGY